MGPRFTGRVDCAVGHQRVVIELSSFKAMSQSDIALRLGLPLPLVQRIASSGLLQMDQTLEDGHG